MTEPKQIDNWQIAYVYVDPELTAAVAVIKGFVNGRLIRSGALEWLDLEKRIAMTKSEIYKVGEPHSRWIYNLVNSGGRLEDLEIKDTTH